MEVWFLFQIVVNITLALGIGVLWLRLRRPPQEDPRLSRGLQLLQSKISVLEDLSDRTDRQVNQLIELLDRKSKKLQDKLFEADQKTSSIEDSVHRSLEVAEIFQDRIPHEEIIERQSTIKYVTAARLANQGLSPEKMAEEVDLPTEQLELIWKVNKDQLVFDESELPDWAKEALNSSEPLEAAALAMAPAAEHQGLTTDEFDPVISSEPPQADLESLKKLGDEFRAACESFDKKQEELETPSIQLAQTKEFLGQAKAATQTVASQMVHKAGDLIGQSVSSAKEVAQKAESFIQEKAQPHIEAVKSHLEFREPQEPPVENTSSTSPAEATFKSDGPSRMGGFLLADENDRVDVSLTPEVEKTSPVIEKKDEVKASLGPLVSNATSRKREFDLRQEKLKKQVQTVRFPRIDERP